MCPTWAPQALCEANSAPGPGLWPQQTERRPPCTLDQASLRALGCWLWGHKWSQAPQHPGSFSGSRQPPSLWAEAAHPIWTPVHEGREPPALSQAEPRHLTRPRRLSGPDSTEAAGGGVSSCRDSPGPQGPQLVTQPHPRKDSSSPTPAWGPRGVVAAGCGLGSLACGKTLLVALGPHLACSSFQKELA